MGLGRSGTTLLDAILGNAEGFFSCGELNRYPYEKGVPYQFPQDYPSHSFWMGLKESMDSNAEVDYGLWASLSRKFDYHSGFLSNYLGSYNRSKFNSYLKSNEILYEKIFSNTNAKVIIDSSKYSNRAISLSRLEKFDVRYIYLKRDPLGVVRSFGKKDVEQGSRSWLSANLYYFAASFLCHFAVRYLRKRNFPVTVVKHERMLENPMAFFSSISTDLNLNLSRLSEKVLNDTPFKVGKLYYGNRVRLLKEVSLEKPSSQASPTNFLERLTITLNKIWY